MKINKKGFVLAETLIVTVFVMVIFTVIYLNYYPILGKYQQREYYDDVDSKYYTYWLKRFIQDDDIITQSTWNRIVSNVEATGGYELKCVQPVNESTNCSDITSNYRKFFATYLEETGNTRIFISKYNLETTKHTNGQDSDVNAQTAIFSTANFGTNKALIPQFKGTAKINYVNLMTAKSGTTANTNRKKIEQTKMQVCVENPTNRFHIQNGRVERAVVKQTDTATTEVASYYTVDDFIKGCLYQAQHPGAGKKPRCFKNGSTYYGKDGNTTSAANYSSQCTDLINNALPNGPVSSDTFYKILKDNSEIIDQDSQLVDYINYLPAFKFPSTKGATYRVIAEYKRKTVPGISDSKTIINTYANIEVKR